jgi:hypothetical protein
LALFIFARKHVQEDRHSLPDPQRMGLLRLVEMQVLSDR